MKKILILMFSIVLLGSCSSEKALSEQIKYDWEINYNSSKDDGSKIPYNLNENLKNSSDQNQSEVQASLPSSKNNQDFLASNDKVEPSVLKNNYSYKKLPPIIQYQKINKSLLEKVQILDKKKASLKASKIKGKKNKVLKVIGTLLLIFFTIIIIGITAIIISWNYHNSFGEIAFTILFLSISAFFTYLSYKSVKKTVKAYSIDNNKNDIKDSID